MAWRPGGDGRVCRIVDGTDGKKEESSADHLEHEREQNCSCQNRECEKDNMIVKTWSMAPLKFEIPGPGKVTNIPAVAFSPSTCT